MKRKYTDLFFDFDDTLYDTHGNAIIALGELFEYFGWAANFEDPELFYSRYWEANVALWSQYAQGEIEREYLILERFRRPLSYGHGLQLTDAYCLQVSDKFLELCSVKPGVVPGAHELMDYLKKKGYRLHICSNGFHEVQYKKLRACGLIDYFDTILLSEDAGANKPAARFFEYALQQSGAAIETTLMIGDNYNTDILGAINVGLDVMYFNPQGHAVDRPDEITYEIKELLEIKEIL